MRCGKRAVRSHFAPEMCRLTQTQSVHQPERRADRQQLEQLESSNITPARLTIPNPTFKSQKCHIPSPTALYRPGVCEVLRKSYFFHRVLSFNLIIMSVSVFLSVPTHSDKLVFSPVSCSQHHVSYDVEINTGTV